MTGHYVGTELDLFSGASNWKAYWSALVRPYLGPRVLDVGAGIGATARAFGRERFDAWLALEPDPALVARMEAEAAAGGFPAAFHTRTGTLADLEPDALFDSILYIDVLEHIEPDRSELELASRHLAPGGRVVVLSPAHQWLYSAFDAAIGHVRRYDRRTLLAAKPAGLEVERLAYLDSVGMLASLGNRLLLRSATPSRGQIAFWDGWMVPVSRWLDALLGRRFGKSILAVYRDPRPRAAASTGAAA